MAERSFEQSIEIGAAPEVVHDFLSDLHRHRDLHPLIERIEDLPGDPGRPAVRRYRVTDRIRLGPLAFRIAYVAELEPFAPDLILAAAWQSPGLELRTRYRLSPSPAGTLVEEEVLLKAPFLLVGYAHRQAKAAHGETLAKLKVLLESDSARDAAPQREQRHERDPRA
jgi:polyketide cyclase/dehydrase/lipid transport protein